jgi:hypothetical protein
MTLKIGERMKVGNLVRRNHYGASSKGWGPVGIIVGPALSLPSDWWIVEWAADGKRETVRKEHIQLVY